MGCPALEAEDASIMATDALVQINMRALMLRLRYLKAGHAQCSSAHALLDDPAY